MPSLFRHHDILRLFVEISRYSSFSDAAHALNMTKGAVSYQIKTLEADLGATLFLRNARGVILTEAGRSLVASCQRQYENVEIAVQAIKATDTASLTVGVSTYFAARWLSQRLMSFMQSNSNIQLRIQPMLKLFDLDAQGVDLAIRWGDGRWTDAEIHPFMALPAFPVGNADMLRRVKQDGLAQAMSRATLLRDHDDSNAWTDWLRVAGLPGQTRRDTLIIPDPNVRVQSVIDGQGIALLDKLSQRELEEGLLFRLSRHELSNYGYYLVRPGADRQHAPSSAFMGWLQDQLQADTVPS